MIERLDSLVEGIRDNGDTSLLGVLSTGELCYVALASARYDLLPRSYADPIEAWHRLDSKWRLHVCQWRGWPENYAHA